jgi:hypothetical protein
MALEEKEKKAAKNWVKKIFSQKMSPILVYPFLDFTINFNNDYYEKIKPLRLEFNPENYFVNIYLFNPQFINLWRKKQKKIIEDSLDDQLSEIYLGDLKSLLLTQKEKNQHEIEKSLDALKGNLAFLLKNILLISEK